MKFGSKLAFSKEAYTCEVSVLRGPDGTFVTSIPVTMINYTHLNTGTGGHRTFDPDFMQSVSPFLALYIVRDGSISTEWSWL